MKAISYTTARVNLVSTMDKVCDDREAVIITRKRNRSVVMLSLEDYSALEETAYLLQYPTNAKRLQAAIESLESGSRREKKLVEGGGK
jgi:antitoxin YefM